MGRAAGVIVALAAALSAIPLGLLMDRAAKKLALEWYEPADPPGESPSHREGQPLPYLLSSGGAVRQFLVVACSVALFAALGTQYGASWRLLVVAAYAAVFITCSETDLLAHRIPDVIVLPAIALAIGVGTAAPGAEVQDMWLGGLISGGVFLAMALTPGGGFGDAKLGLFAGLALGFPLAVYAVFIATISAGIGAFAVLASSRFTAWGRAIPYGPYIALGALAVMLAGGTAFVRV